MLLYSKLRQRQGAADKLTLTQQGLDAYQKVIDELQQVQDVAESRLAEGFVNRKRDTLLCLLTHAGLALSDAEHARIQSCKDAATLDRWIDNVLGAKSALDVFSR